MVPQCIQHTVMSLLEVACTKTSWRVLLFRAILGITGALIACCDIWRFKQVNNNETSFGSHHCAVFNCACAYEFRKFVLETPGVSTLWGRYYSVTMCTHLGALLLGRALLIRTLRYQHFWLGISKVSPKFCQICPVPIDLTSSQTSVMNIKHKTFFSVFFYCLVNFKRRSLGFCLQDVFSWLLRGPWYLQMWSAPGTCNNNKQTSEKLLAHWPLRCGCNLS